jgi:hypothetical protein
MIELNTAQMNRALTVLRCLKPRERLRVIAQALPEAERELETPRRRQRQLSGTTPRWRRLRQLWSKRY